MSATSSQSRDVLSVRPLEPDDLPRALALVRLVAPHLSLPAWTSLAERYGVVAGAAGAAASDTCGILAVENRSGYMFGLCSLRVVPDIVHDRRLDAENIIVVGFGDDCLVRRTLSAAIEREARARGCRAISIHDVPVLRGELSRLDHGAPQEALATTAYRVICP